MSTEEPIPEESQQKLSFVWPAIVVVLALILVILLAGRHNRNDPTSAKGDPLDDPIILRNNVDYERANTAAANFARAGFLQLAQGEALTPENAKNLRQAARLYDAMTAYQPSNPAPDFACGQVLHGLGYEDHATTKLRQFLAMVGPKPKNDAVRVMVADAHGLIAACQTATHNYRLAVEESNIALGMYPNTPEYLVERGSAEVQLHEDKEATADLQAAIKASDESDPARTRALEMLKLLGAKS